MAFIVPLTVGEQLLVKDPHIADLFPKWMWQPKRWVAVVLLLTVATNQRALTANLGVIAAAVMMAMSVRGAFPNVIGRSRHETAAI